MKESLSELNIPISHISFQTCTSLCSPLRGTCARCVQLVVGVGENLRPLLSNHKLLFCQKHVEAPAQPVPTKGKLTSSHNTCRDKCQGIQAADYCASWRKKIFIKIIDKA